MKKWLFLIMLATVLVLAACGGGDDTDTDNSSSDDGPQTEETTEGSSVDASAAEAAFKQNCASCHGADLTGNIGPNLTEVGKTKTKEDIMDIIENGKGQMPAGQATGDDVELIASWLAEHK